MQVKNWNILPTNFAFGNPFLMFVDWYKSMIGAYPFPFFVPSYCYLMLKIMMFQDSHHKYNSSQRLKNS
jgi:hypothetical protein